MNGPTSSTIVACVFDLLGDLESWESPKLTSKDANQAMEGSWESRLAALEQLPQAAE